MASILQNDLFLVLNNPNDGINPTVSFSGQSGATGATGGTGSTPLVVGFYPIIGGNLALTPSSYLCPNTSYLIRVALPNQDTIYWLSNPSINSSMNSGNLGNSVNFTLNSTTSNAVLFQPVYTNTEINSYYNFPAILQVNSTNSTLTPQNYQIQPSPNFETVGYTSPLPILLSNCAACGCPTSRNCNTTTGVCQGLVPTCQANAVCGSLGGSCPGYCASTNGRVTNCQLVGNQYTCVPDKRSSPAATIAWILLIAFALFIFFFIIGLIIYRLYKPVQVTQELQPVGSPEWREGMIWDSTTNSYRPGAIPVQPVVPV